jgi:curved DNA-binding protein CbpA
MQKLVRNFCWVQFDSSQNLYKLLNSRQSDPICTIKKNYYILAKQLHPDVSSNSEEHFKRVSGAWDILSDLDKRAHYDLFLAKVNTIFTWRNWDNRRVWKGRMGDNMGLEISERSICGIRKTREITIRVWMAISRITTRTSSRGDFISIRSIPMPNRMSGISLTNIIRNRDNIRKTSKFLSIS